MIFFEASLVERERKERKEGKKEGREKTRSPFFCFVSFPCAFFLLRFCSFPNELYKNLHRVQRQHIVPHRNCERNEQKDRQKREKKESIIRRRRRRQTDAPLTTAKQDPPKLRLPPLAPAAYTTTKPTFSQIASNSSHPSAMRLRVRSISCWSFLDAAMIDQLKEKKSSG